MTLHQEFIKVVKKKGDKLAIIDRATNRRVTYARSLVASLILANKIKKYEDDFIGIMIPTSAGAMLSIFGVLMAGKTPVMLNYSTGAAQNAKYAQNKCGFKTIITSKSFLDKIRCPYIDDMIFIEDVMKSITLFDKIKAVLKAKLPVSILQNLVHKGSNDDNVVIMFTSGSEKDPKVVQLTHRNIGSNVRDIQVVLEIRDEDVMLANLPLFHVFGHNTNFWLPLLSGLTVVTYANPLEYRTISNIVREEEVTLMVGTPSFFLGYLRQSEPGDYATIRIAVTGADKAPDSLRKSFMDKHNVELYEGYGTTETSPVISTNTPSANKPGSVGKPLPSVQVKIVDVTTGNVLAQGQEGKILVKGDLVMKGYLDDLAETSLRIQDGWYETGDMGVLDQDGYLWHRGRLKRFVKIGGEMVSLVKIESVLNELLPSDIECCVVEIPDAVKGAKIVVAVCKEVDQNRLMKALSEKLPPIALPKQFLVLGELPKMSSGKIDFRTITEKVMEQFLNKNF